MLTKIEYDQTSPYFQTGIYDNALDVMSHRKITRSPDDKIYTIDKIYENRPDLLAYDLYGRSKLWWVFAARNPNVFEDPVMDFKAGVTMYLPKKDTLFKDLGL